MQPGNYYDFLSNNDALQPFRKTRADFEPGIGRSFQILSRCFVPTLQVGANETDWLKRI